MWSNTCVDDRVIPPNQKFGRTFYTLYMCKDVISLLYYPSNVLLKFLIKKIITFFFKSHQLKMRLDQESILPAPLLALPRALEFAFGFVNKWKGPNRSGRHRVSMW